MTTGQRYRIKGINDDVDYCGCCGKTGLKRVVWLAPLDTDGNECAEASPYGTTCAAYKLCITKDKAARASSKIKAAIRQALEKAVDAKIAAVRVGFVTLEGRYLVPADSDFSKPTAAILTARDARFPILTYLNGVITLEQAARYL